MSKWVKIAAGVIAAVAVVILAYALLTPNDTSSTDTSDHMGMNGHMMYSSANVGLIAIGTTLIVASLMVVLLLSEYEPLSPEMARHAAVAPPPPSEVGPPVQSPVEQICEPKEEIEAARNYLVLRLLTGDERTMFKAIMDSGNEALQKDLIVRTKMSNAKVSRVLDRLEQKGVITKDRHGSTNKVRIKTNGSE